MEYSLICLCLYTFTKTAMYFFLKPHIENLHIINPYMEFLILYNAQILTSDHIIDLKLFAYVAKGKIILF